MVERIDNLEEDILQLHQVKRVAVLWNDLALNGGLDLVVVSVRAWMVATSELLLVLFDGQVGIMQPMGSTKRHSSREVGDWAHFAIDGDDVLVILVLYWMLDGLKVSN